jgi:hypothetical protein
MAAEGSNIGVYFALSINVLFMTGCGLCAIGAFAQGAFAEREASPSCCQCVVLRLRFTSCGDTT